MSDRAISTFQRQGRGNLRGQVLETMIQQASSLDPDLWTVMDQRDNTLIEEEILHGAGSSKYVYSFKIGTTPVTGISVIGARELAAHYKGIQHRMVGSISKIGSVFVMKSYPSANSQMGLFVQQLPELEDEDDYYEVLVELKDIKTGNIIQVEKRESRHETRSEETLRQNPHLPAKYERPHYQIIAGSKAYRNGVLTLIPQALQLEWKQRMLLLNKTDIITGSLIDEKRAGVLRYAASKAIGVDRVAIEALTFEQIAGLSDAVREGRAEQFVQSAAALGIVTDAPAGDERAQQRTTTTTTTASPKDTPARQAANGATQQTGTTQGGAAQTQTKAAVATKAEPNKPADQKLTQTGSAPAAKEASQEAAGGQAEGQQNGAATPRTEVARQETEAERNDRERPLFHYYALDEFGDPVTLDNGDMLQFFQPQEFALWYNKRTGESDNPAALREHNADALQDAAADPTAKVMIDAAHSPDEARPATVDVKPDEPSAPIPVLLETLSNRQRTPNWPKYVKDCETEITGLKTVAEVEAWEKLNVPTYVGKTTAYASKVDALIAARRAVINRAPVTPDPDMEQAKKLIQSLNETNHLHEYEALVRNAAIRSWCKKMSAERPEIRDLVRAADDAAAERLKPRTAPEQSAQTTANEPPMDEVPWDRDITGDPEG